MIAARLQVATNMNSNSEVAQEGMASPMAQLERYGLVDRAWCNGSKVPLVFWLVEGCAIVKFQIKPAIAETNTANGPTIPSRLAAIISEHLENMKKREM